MKKPFIPKKVKSIWSSSFDSREAEIPACVEFDHHYMKKGWKVAMIYGTY